MNIHWQFTIEDRQFRMILIRQIIMIELIASSTLYLYGAVTFYTLLYRPHRSDGRRTANVARTIITIYNTKRAFTNFLHQLLTIRKILIMITLCITKAVGHHDATAINALPQADSKRITAVALIERFGTPNEFL